MWLPSDDYGRRVPAHVIEDLIVGQIWAIGQDRLLQTADWAGRVPNRVRRHQDGDRFVSGSKRS